MNVEKLKQRIAELIGLSSDGNPSYSNVGELHQGVLSVVRALYGPGSSNEALLADQVNAHKHNRPDLVSMRGVLRGALKNMEREIETGFIGSLQARIAGEVLSDMVGLAKEALREPGEEAKNVACVLAAAAFEDTLRRIAEVRGVPQQEKLADIVTALKVSNVLQGSQVGIAQSYLAFRNRSLHAKWSEVERPEAQSVIAFTEALLTVHLA